MRLKNTLLCFFLVVLAAFFFPSCQKRKSNPQQNQSLDIKDSIAIWLSQIREKTLTSSEKKNLLEKTLSFSQNLEHDTLRTKVISQVSLAYKRLGDTSKFKKTNSSLRELAADIEDYQSLGEAYWDLGDFYGYSKPDSAYYFYKQAYDKFLKANLSEGARDYPGRILYVTAQVKDRNKDYVGAEKDAVAAIDFFTKNGFQIRLFDAYNQLAIIQNGLNNFDNSIKYNELAKTFIKHQPKKNQLKDSLYSETNIGATYMRHELYYASAEIFKEIVDIDSLQFKEPTTYAKAMASLAISKLNNGEANFDEIYGLLQTSNQILDSIGDVYHQARNQEYLADLMIAKEDTAEAIRAATKAKAIAQETNNNDRLLSSLQLLTKIDRANSAQHAQYYFALDDSLQRIERNMRDKFALIEMETDEVIQENEQLARQKKVWTGVAIGLLLLAIATYIIITQRANNQRLRFEQQQQEANQEIYDLMLNQQGKLQEGKQLEQKRISEELHDGVLGQMLGIRLILSGLNNRDDESAVAQRGELLQKLQELEEEIRTISHELNDASYQKIHNFILAIEDLVKTINDSSTIETSFSYDKSENWDALNGDFKINVYRIVQECLQNCIKHSQCENVTVNLGTKSNILELAIVDDGKGFDTKKAKKGIGLKNITSRVEKLLGSLHIESSKGNGTAIRIFIPKRQGQNNILDGNSDSRKLEKV